jgi:hypothetical protein
LPGSLAPPWAGSLTFTFLYYYAAFLVISFMSRFTIIVSSISFISLFLFFKNRQDETSWIRINLLGYKPASTKVAVWCSKENKAIKTFQVIDAATKKIAFNGSAGKAFGGYCPFTETYRLNCRQVVQNHRCFKLVKMHTKAVLIFACGICANKEQDLILF